jgi:hypothetical protein
LAFALYLFEVPAKPRQSRPLAFALYLFEVSAKPRQSRNLEEVFLPTPYGVGRNERFYFFTSFEVTLGVRSLPLRGSGKA